MAKNFIAGAIKNPGSLRATAKAKGMIKGDQTLTGTDLSRLSNSSNATTRRRANLAKTLKKLGKGKR